MSSEQLKIVLCDDSMLVRKQLKEILTDAGVKTILEASNGNEALPLIKKHNPQIVFFRHCYARYEWD